MGTNTFLFSARGVIRRAWIPSGNGPGKARWIESLTQTVPHDSSHTSGKPRDDPSDAEVANQGPSLCPSNEAT